MEEEPQTLSGIFLNAERRRKEIDSAFDQNTIAFQENVTAAIAAYEQCLKIADQVSLFSPNETLEDVSSKNLPYFSLNFRYAELLQRDRRQDRRILLEHAKAGYEAFLKLLDNYDMLSKENSRLFERWRENSEQFSTVDSSDAARRRETKIARYKQEKEFKAKLQVPLLSIPSSI